MTHTPTKREHVTDKNLPFEFSRWRTLPEHVSIAGGLPVVYELGIGKSPDKIESVVYCGGATEEIQRGKQYKKDGSHKKDNFDEARAAGYEVYVRTKRFTKASDAFQAEAVLLYNFDYAWNDQDQVNKVKRSACESVFLSKKTKVSSEFQLSEVPEAKKNTITNKYLKPTKEHFIQARLEKAEADPAFLDNLEPRKLVFKKGHEYDANLPLRDQLDMRNKLNQLYVKRAELKDPTRLDPHPPLCREKTPSEAGAVGSGVRLKKDGTPDRRYKENKGPPDSLQEFLENQNKAKTSEPSKPTNLADSIPLKKDGTPDMRYKQNKEPANNTTSTSSSTYGSNTPPPMPKGPLTKKGKPDMRYKANRKPASTPPSMRSTTTAPSRPLRADGQPDRRFAVNRNSSPSYSSPSRGPLTRSGAPDMRYAANRSYSSARGPLKKDGTPDMRYKANRRK